MWEGVSREEGKIWFWGITLVLTYALECCGFWTPWKGWTIGKLRRCQNGGLDGSEGPNTSTTAIDSESLSSSLVGLPVCYHVGLLSFAMNWPCLEYSTMSLKLWAYSIKHLHESVWTEYAVLETSVYSHWGIKLSCDKWRIMENEWGIQKIKRAPLLPIKLMLENRVYACEQDFPILKPRVRQTHSGAPQNQQWEERALLAGSLAHRRKERGRDRLIKVTSSTSSCRESYWEMPDSAGRSCIWEETFRLETSFFPISYTQIPPF